MRFRALHRSQIAFAVVCFLFALMSGGIATSSATAAWSALEFYGNPTPAAGTKGGEFGTNGTSPRGIAVNDPAVSDGNGVDADIYVADTANNRVQQFQADGTFVRAWGTDVVAPAGVGGSSGAGNANEVQAVMVNAAAGQFKLTFGPDTTADLPFSANAAEVQSALNALASINAGGGSVSVSGGSGDVGGKTPYLVNFKGGSLAGTDVALLVGSVGTTPLSGGVGTGANAVTVSTFAPGGGSGTAFEICEVAANCKAGIAASGVGGNLVNASGVAVNQNSGDVYVTSGNTNGGLLRVDQFDAHGNFIRSWGRDVVASGPGDNPTASAVQTLTVTATGGKYKLKFHGIETTELAAGPAGATAAQVQTALQALAPIGSGNLTVAGAIGGPYTLTFASGHANNPEPLIEATSSIVEPLTGGTATVINTTSGSNGFEICTASATCKSGNTNLAGAVSASAPASPAIVPGGLANEENVLVADAGAKRISEFTANGTFVRAFGWDVVAAGPSNTPGATFEICKASGFDACKSGVAGGNVGQFGGSGFDVALAGIAVDGNGVTYISEGALIGGGANFRVQRFASGPSLTPSVFGIASGTSIADTPTQIAIDPTNDHLYVVKTFTTERRIVEIDPALNSGNGEIVATHAAGAPFGNSVNGLAVRRSGFRGYVTSINPRPGLHVLGEVVAPTPTIAATTAIGTTTVTLHGTVEPNGGPNRTSYRFEYKRASDPDVPASWSKAPAVDVDLGTGEGAGDPNSCPAGNPPVCNVSQHVTGLEPNQDYDVRLVAIKASTPVTSTGNAGDFKTAQAPPTAVTFPAYWDGAEEELVLRGGVNPSNLPTTYYFEYGTEPCSSNSCASVPVNEDASAGAGGHLTAQSQRLTGLSGNTTYYFRVVADNGVGVEPVFGADREFHVPDLTPCSNEQLREENDSTGLAECRAYEWVSNGDSWGAGVFSFQRSSSDGERAQFLAQAYGQPKSVPAVGSPYIAMRGDGAWSVATASPPADRAFNGSLELFYEISDDLTKALWPGVSPGDKYRQEVQWLYANTDGGILPATSKLVPLRRSFPPYGLASFSPLGASSDLSTFVFGVANEGTSKSIAYFPDEPVRGLFVSNLYAVTGAGGPDPTLTLVSRETDPSPGVPGAPIGGTCGAGPGGSLGDIAFGKRENAVSDDGSVVYFSAMPGATITGGSVECRKILASKRLYKRVDQSTTVQVSKPTCSRVANLPAVPACETTAPAGAPITGGADEYQQASTDGSIVFFTSPRQLTDSDTDGTNDLYVHDEDPAGSGEPKLVQASAGEEVVVTGTAVTTENSKVLTAVTNSGSDPFVAGLRISGPGIPANTTITKVISSTELELSANATASQPSGVSISVTMHEVGNGAEVTGFLSSAADGSRVYFTAKGKLTPEATRGVRNLYVYQRDADEPSGRLEFIATLAPADSDLSFMSLPARGDGDGHLLVFASALRLLEEDLDAKTDIYRYDDEAEEMICVSCMGNAGIDAGFVNSGGEDGSAVAFTTGEALLDHDLNGARDVYLWRDGTLSRPSERTGGFGVAGAGVSPDGDNVFFTTLASLDARDLNNGLDVYVARVGGGFPQPVPPPNCLSADECQPPDGPPSAPSGPSTPGFVGPGNPQSSKPPCKKGQVRKKGKCVKWPSGKKKKNGKHTKRSAKK